MDFTGVTTTLEVRAYAASLGQARESKLRTYAVPGPTVIELTAAPETRCFKVQVTARDDDDSGQYGVSIVPTALAVPARRGDALPSPAWPARGVGARRGR